jgi:hypothetical protein
VEDSAVGKGDAVDVAIAPEGEEQPRSVINHKKLNAKGSEGPTWPLPRFAVSDSVEDTINWSYGRRLTASS